MTTFLLYLLLWIWDNRSYGSIARSNQIKTQAEQAYAQNQFGEAAALYHRITYGSIFSEPSARLNLAHAYYQAGRPDQALHHYRLLEDIRDRRVASRANVQIALIAVSEQDTAAALQRLVRALRQDQDNLTARYNYELLKKTFSGRTPPSKNRPEPTPPPEAPQPAPTTPQEQEGQSPEQAEQREQLLQQLRQLRMSEEQARSILDAMKTNEMQHIYQLRRRQYRDQSEKSKEIEW